MPTTVSPLRYPGGKTVYANMISEIIDKNNLSNRIFVETFAGGAGAALKLLLSRKVPAIILNDYDLSIYSFWHAILNDTEAFLHLLNETPITLKEWYRQRDIYHNNKKDLLAQGFATFYLNRCNRAGILAANPIGGLHQTGKYKIDARFNKAKLTDKIKAIVKFRSCISISNMNCIDFINQMKKEHNPDELFIYFDPPYYEKGELLYLNHFDHEQHVELRDYIQNIPFAWLLSYDDETEIREMYKSFPTYKKTLQYSVAKPSIGHELIITRLKMPKGLKRIMR